MYICTHVQCIPCQTLRVCCLRGTHVLYGESSSNAKCTWKRLFVFCTHIAPSYLWLECAATCTYMLYVTTVPILLCSWRPSFFFVYVQYTYSVSPVLCGGGGGPSLWQYHLAVAICVLIGLVMTIEADHQAPLPQREARENIKGKCISLICWAGR